MRGFVAVVMLVAVACGDDARRGTSDAAPIADPDAYCHFDCFGSTTCADGVVTVVEHAPVECQEWTGACPSSTLTCSDGCELDGASWFGTDAAPFACALPAKQVGDACPCLPTRAVDVGDGTVTQTYLACVDGLCAEAAPPVVEGWLEPCRSGDAPCLDGGACAVRTTYCLGDWECPEGATCDLVPGEDTPVCRPGPRGAPVELAC